MNSLSRGGSVGRTSRLRGAWPVFGAVVLAALAATSVGAAGETTKVSAEEGTRHWEEIAKVLQSPRCRNCHPAGDAPLHSDAGVPHSMNVSRKSLKAGLSCSTCHRTENQPEEHTPPGVPNWHMPAADTPMVFEGLSHAELCKRLKDPQQNGNRTPEMLQEHMDHDKFVLWAWSPGKGRTTPPITHDELMKHVKAWVDAGAPCPK
jgi:hypothetical protein